jgi:hypothetical protein
LITRLGYTPSESERHNDCYEQRRRQSGDEVTLSGVAKPVWEESPRKESDSGRYGNRQSNDSHTRNQASHSETSKERDKRQSEQNTDGKEKRFLSMRVRVSWKDH